MTSLILINKQNGLNILVNGIFLIVAEYLPLLFLSWLIYIWIKKDDAYMDLVLYSIYATILGISISYLAGIVYSQLSGSNIIIFMLSVALILAYFKETRRSGIILIVLGLIGIQLRIFYALNTPLEVFLSGLWTIVSTIIIYLLKDGLNEVNEIFKAAYYVFR